MIKTEFFQIIVVISLISRFFWSHLHQNSCDFQRLEKIAKFGDGNCEVIEDLNSQIRVVLDLILLPSSY